MAISAAIPARRTSADVVYDHLYDQISTLELLPGSKISEADIAAQYGVSRQPVREAFNRLGNMGLLLIQPQRATVVQKFSLEAIDAARFVRLSIELEIVRVAAENWSDTHLDAFTKNLDAQNTAVDQDDARAFHNLDAEFHSLITDVAGKPYAFDVMMEKKAQIDRICVLSLKQAHEMRDLVNDHLAIFDRLKAGDAPGAQARLRVHLSRIQSTIDAVRASHPGYFEA